MLIKHCVICDKEFKVPPNRGDTAKCCSLICRNKLIKLDNRNLKVTEENKKYIQDICILPDNITYEGHKVYMNNDYPAIYINGKSYNLHRYIWEQTYGSIPKGMVIHHKDFNRGNWDINNLEMLTRAEHLRKHKINRWNNGMIIKSKDKNKEVI